MFLRWEEKYSVKNYLLDEQHKKLFEIANVADNMISKQTDPIEIKKVLSELFLYMKTHFQNEETYMASIQYPYLETHKLQHQQIVIQMTSLVKHMKHDFKQQLVIIMEHWLLKHILQEDMGYALYCEEMNKKRAKANNKRPQEDDEVILKPSLISTKTQNNAKKHMYVYICLCGKAYNIAPDIHKKIQQGNEVRCKDCATSIKYITNVIL